MRRDRTHKGGQDFKSRMETNFLDSSPLNGPPRQFYSHYTIPIYALTSCSAEHYQTCISTDLALQSIPNSPRFSQYSNFTHSVAFHKICHIPFMPTGRLAQSSYHGNQNVLGTRGFSVLQTHQALRLLPSPLGWVGWPPLSLSPPKIN